MKTVERIIIKLIIIQLLFLIIVQIFFHKNNMFPELKEITQYEGVTEYQFSNILDVFNNE